MSPSLRIAALLVFAVGLVILVLALWLLLLFSFFTALVPIGFSP